LNIIQKLFPLLPASAHPGTPWSSIPVLTVFLRTSASCHPLLPEIRATMSVKGATSYKLKPSPFCQLLGKPSVLRQSF